MNLKKYLMRTGTALLIAISTQTYAGAIGGHDNRHLGNSDSCPNLNQGNPINVATGNKYQSLNLFKGANSFPLNFTMHYNSRVFNKGLRSGRSSSLKRYQGVWSHSYSHAGNMSPISGKNSRPYIVIVRPDGAHSGYFVDPIIWRNDGYSPVAFDARPNVRPQSSHTPNASQSTEKASLRLSSVCSEYFNDSAEFQTPIPGPAGSPKGPTIIKNRKVSSIGLGGSFPSQPSSPGIEVSPIKDTLLSDGSAPVSKFVKDDGKICLTGILKINRPDGITEYYTAHGKFKEHLKFQLSLIEKDGESQRLQYIYNENKVVDRIKVHHINGQSLNIDLDDESYLVNGMGISRPVSLSIETEDPDVDTSKASWSLSYNAGNMLENVVLHKGEDAVNVARYAYRAMPGSSGWLHKTALTNYYRNSKLGASNYGQIAGWAYDARGRAFRSYRGISPYSLNYRNQEYPAVDRIQRLSTEDFFAMTAGNGATATEAYQFSELNDSGVATQFDNGHIRKVKNHLGKEATFYFSQHDGLTTPSLTYIQGNGIVNCASGTSRYTYYKKNTDDDGYDGQLKTVKDAKGFVKTFKYHKDGVGNLKSVTHQVDSAADKNIDVHYSWTLDQKISKVTTPNLETSYEYEKGKITKIVQKDLDYRDGDLLFPNGHPIEAEQRETNIEYTYSPIRFGRERLAQAIIKGPQDSYDLSQKTKIIYDGFGKVTSIIDNYAPTSGVELEYKYEDYNLWGVPQKIIDPSGLVTTFGYSANASGLKMTSMKVGTDNPYYFEYHDNLANKIEKVTYPDGTWLKFTYRCYIVSDNCNSDITSISSSGKQGAIKFNKQRKPDEHIVETLIEILSYNQKTTYKSSVITDALGRLYKVASGEDSATKKVIQQEYNYDALGNLTNIKQHGVSQNGAALTIDNARSYNGLRQIASTNTPLSSSYDKATTEFTYDNQQDFSGIIDAEGRQTKYIRNGFGEIIQRDSPDTGITRYFHDKSGNLTHEFRGVGTDELTLNRFYYDSLNRVTRIEADKSLYILKYDGDSASKGRLSEISGSFEGTQRFGYLNGRLFVSSVSVQHDRKSVVRDVLVNLPNNEGKIRADIVNVNFGNSEYVNYEFDDVGRINKIDVAGQTLIDNVEYLPFGPVKRFDLSVAEGSYDADYGKAYMLESIQANAKGNATYTASFISDKGFGNYDKITQSSDASHSFFDAQTSYVYDQSQRLIKSTGKDEQVYTYNKIGDAQRFDFLWIERTLKYVFNPDGTHILDEFKFNKIGNASKQSRSDIVHDGLGRLYSNGKTRYDYDVFNRRIKKSNIANSENDVHFGYDSNGRLAVETSSSNGQLIKTRRYVYLYDKPVAMVDYDAEGNRSFYNIVTNHLNAPVMVIDENGNTVWEAAYMPFGYAWASKYDIEFNLRFPGQYFDRESNMHYNMQRYYNPYTGRYLQSDPIGLAGGVNTYAYVNNNPVNYVDPDGLLGHAIGPGIGRFVIAPAINFGIRWATSGRALTLGDLLYDVMNESADDGTSESGDSEGSSQCDNPATTGGPGNDQDPDDDPNNENNDKYENPGHHDPRGGANAANSTKSTLPRNHQELWNKSIRTNNKTRWAKEGSGKNAIYHRFQNDGRGGPFHWNGSTSGARSIPKHQVPNKIIKL